MTYVFKTKIQCRSFKAQMLREVMGLLGSICPGDEVKREAKLCVFVCEISAVLQRQNFNCSFDTCFHILS